MREIEVKARVSDLIGIRSALEKQGIKLSEQVTQHDVVWGLAGVDGSGDNRSPWLRIRSETRRREVKHIFTLKRSVTNQLDSIEHETEVGDPGELEQIIKELGFELYSDLTKMRQKAQIGDVEICLDSVEGLGSFIEAEKLVADDAEHGLVAQELWTVLESLGVDRTHEVTDGYDVMMNKQLGRE